MEDPSEKPRPEKPRKAPPPPTPRPDWRVALDALGSGGSSPMQPPDDTAVKELLIRWDELPQEDLDVLVCHPVLGPRLARLREAEAWLVGQSQQADACPDAQELYDYGRGPGYAALTTTQRREIDRRLALCSLGGRCECEALIQSLVASAPTPLEFEGLEVPDVLPPLELPALEPTEKPGLPRRVGARWMPLAAAAAVLVLSTLVFRNRQIGAGEGLPQAPILRSEAEQALLFPRGPVLARKRGRGGVFADAPLFELAEVAGATRYSLVLHRHTGGAFSAGTEVARLEGEAPLLRSQESLKPGHYTWEAWADVDGLLRHLGERDFRVTEDEALWIDLNRLEPMGRVRHLHDSGYLTDARHEARALPPSPARDAYLEVRPGR